MNNNSVLFEAIVSNSDDALAAEAGGADRFEFCSALALGGLTPSLGTLQEIKSVTNTPVMCMIRPREGGMYYSDGEFKSMLRDAELMVNAGADGIVFGLLKQDGSLDIGRCKEFLQVIENASQGRSLQTVFHRAFDVIQDPENALEQLVDLGVTRILTSGRKAEAEDGIDEIRRMIDLARGRIQILPGGGLHSGNVERVVRETGANQVHLYLAGPHRDPSPAGNPEIYFGVFIPESEEEIRVVEETSVAHIRSILDSI